MNTVLVTVALLIGILVLIMPISLKKVIYILGSLALIVCIWLMNNRSSEFGKVQIKATDTHNDSALGSEIWLKEVIINGKGYDPSEYFSDGWIKEDGYLKWRSYDKTNEIKDTINAEFKVNDEVQLIFSSNKWRGIVEVISWNGDQTMDCYEDTENGNSTKLFDLYTTKVN